MTKKQNIVVDNYISRRSNSVSPSGIRRFFDLVSSTEGLISLGVGEPDFVTPWHIREAAINSLEKGYTMYTSNYGTLELRQKLAEYLESNYKVGYDPKSEILITTGSSEALDIALRATLDPGDEVIMPDPCYVAHPALTVLSEGKPVFIQTTEEKEFRITASDVVAKLTDKTKSILLGYPANPTGAVMPRDELVKISEVARKNDLLVISDEIYAKLVYEVSHTCFSSLPDMKDRAILIGGFSKSHAMTGWRIGFVAAHKTFIEAMTKVHQYTMMCAPIMAQVAALEALENGEGEVTAMVEEYDRRRKTLLGGLREIGLTCFEPKGAFYTFPSIKITGLSSDEFAERLLNEEKVVVVPGSAFGKGGEGYIRCCYATSLPDIQEAINRIGKFVARHRKNV